MKMVLRPRPSGETARVVFKEYDVPLQAELNMPPKDPMTDGSDWLNGTPSRRGSLVHDAWADLDGNLWFTSNVPNHEVTVGHIDTQTGAVKMLKVPGANGLAANTHGMTRDPNGIIWFNVNTGRGGLGRLDPKTEKIEVFLPPAGMSPTGGATTVDWDGKGEIWSSAPDGALRFDPVNGEVHRVQVRDLQDAERQRHHLRRRRRSRRQRLVGGNDHRHRQQGRQRRPASRSSSSCRA